ncbi:MAG TPA: hypothetical protein VGS57_12215 [Thermoanaerobaculia bacterium]|jgi:hypothetical protein|nr:hypothetical protein [Thermoanaerobaculia bacterium]
MSAARGRATREWAIVVAVIGIVAALGHRWVELGWQAARYHTASPSARTQVVVDGERAYVAAGIDGIEVVDLSAARRVALVRVPAPADRIDDVAVADGWLFALDATPPGHLMTFRLADLGATASPAAIVEVPVGPFSGVSAAAGLAAVSGGTSQLTLREYDAGGRFGAEVATADYGRGQPDVALRADGALAAVSTHIVGPDFALTLVEIARRPLRLRELARLPLRDAGFTTGGFKPAHFPFVAAWRGDRVFVADGGGLAVVDAADPAHPRLLRREPLARPAIDVAVAGDELDVLRAGSEPAVVRCRLDGDGLPTVTAIWTLPRGDRAAAIARHGAVLVVTRHERGWSLVPPRAFTTVPSR